MKRLLLLSTLAFQSFPVSAFFVNLEVVHAGCGNATGQITAQVTGGVGPYNYLWSPAPATGQGTSQAGGLLPGGYSVDVTDAMATVVTVSVTVLALPGLDVGAALNQSGIIPPCPLQCNGQLFLNENLLGGLAPFSINTVPAMPLNALCGNMTFDVVVSDALGCVGTATTIIPEQIYPTLLGTILNGPCPGVPTSVEVFFDLYPFSITDPGGSPTNASGGPNGGIEIAFPQPYGTYTFTYDMPGCGNQSYPIIFPGAIANCGNVDGFLYVDVNGNCIQDGTDFPLSHEVVTVNPGGYTAMTDFMGHYQMQVPFGTYDLIYSSPFYAQLCPGASPVNFTLSGGSPTATIDLALNSGDPDVAISCAFGQAVPGFVQTNWFTITNNSAIPSGPLTLDLVHDPVQTAHIVWYCGGGGPVNYANLPWYPDVILPGSATWNLPDGLQPGDQQLLRIDLLLPPNPLLIGTPLNFTATLSSTLNDADLSNNTCTHTETVVGSFDPNDKQARTTSGSNSSWYIAQDSSAVYTIRFQNTGTAPAVNVVLLDTIGALLDLSTLEIVGASHTFNASLDTARVLRFTFDHIMLPDSNTNEPASHGFAQFSIRPVAGLSPGQTIANAADIFFDFNPPIRTNTSELFVEFGVGTVEATTTGLAIHPNPASDLLILSGLPAGRSAVEIMGVDGRLVQRSTAVNDRIAIDRLVPGAYVLKLIATDGSTGTVRFVKQ